MNTGCGIINLHALLDSLQKNRHKRLTDEIKIDIDKVKPKASSARQNPCCYWFIKI